MMFRRGIILIAAIFFNLQLCFGAEEGFFNLQNGSQYLGFSNMNKEFGITSLMNSAIANDAQATQVFVRSGDNVNQKNIAGATALHLAARNGSYDSAKILVEAGADVNARDNEGWTPLMRASLAGNIQLIELLINNSADVWTVNQNNDSALVHAAMANCYECAEIILEFDGAQSDLVSKKGQIFKSSEIVKKRYNEPFMELLNSQNTGKSTTVINIVDDDVFKNTEKNVDGDNVAKLIYVFTGKVITTDELKKLSKENYNNAVKSEKKIDKNVVKENGINLNKNELKKDKNINQVVEIEDTKSTLIMNDAEYEFGGSKITQKEIDRQKKEMMQSVNRKTAADKKEINTAKKSKKNSSTTNNAGNTSSNAAKGTNTKKASATAEKNKAGDVSKSNVNKQKQTVEPAKTSKAVEPVKTSKAVEPAKTTSQNSKTAESAKSNAVKKNDGGTNLNSPKTEVKSTEKAKPMQTASTTENKQPTKQNSSGQKPSVSTNKANNDEALKALQEREAKKKAKKPVKELDKPVEVKDKKITYTLQQDKAKTEQINLDKTASKDNVKYQLQNDDSKLTYTKKSAPADNESSLQNGDGSLGTVEKKEASKSDSKKYILKEDSGSLN